MLGRARGNHVYITRCALTEELELDLCSFQGRPLILFRQATTVPITYLAAVFAQNMEAILFSALF